MKKVRERDLERQDYTAPIIIHYVNEDVRQSKLMKAAIDCLNIWCVLDVQAILV